MFGFKEAMEYIDSRERFGTKQGTARMEHIAKTSGLYEMIKDIKFIHVAGTNGKGSASVMLSSVLTAAGYKTGLYVSPYIEEFTERISVDGVRISEEDFASCLDYFRPFIEKADLETLGDMKAFELITLAGLLYFARCKCEYVCLEVGIGGRLDATNIINPALGLIMSISFDHMAQLGNTLEKIATEKCGIIKNGVSVVSYPDQRPEALSVIEKTCRERGCELYLPKLPKLTGMENGTDFIYNGRQYHTALTGIHQAKNCVVVLEAVEILKKGGAVIDEAAIHRGLALARNPGRLEILLKAPLVILDGAHNEGGAKALADSLPLVLGKRVPVFVMGMCADHASPEIFETVLSKDAFVYTARAKGNDRAMDAEALSEAVKPYCKGSQPCQSLDEALGKASQKAGDGGAVVCFGSLFIAKEIRAAVKKTKATE